MIEENAKQALIDLKQILEQCDVSMLIIGAGARLIVFDTQFGEGRSTKDWDVGVTVSSWEAYDRLRIRLTQGDPPIFDARKAAHKFVHIATRTEIDIVPFGDISTDDETIVWPDSGNPMNVSGLAEALICAQTATIDGLELKVVSTPALVALKLFAWSDRCRITQKDLHDIRFILDRYEDYNRAYTELSEQLADERIQLTDASAYLLGRDMKAIFNPSTCADLIELLGALLLAIENKRDESVFRRRLELVSEGLST